MASSCDVPGAFYGETIYSQPMGSSLVGLSPEMQAAYLEFTGKCVQPGGVDHDMPLICIDQDVCKQSFDCPGGQSLYASTTKETAGEWQCKNNLIKQDQMYLTDYNVMLMQAYEATKARIGALAGEEFNTPDLWGMFYHDYYSPAGKQSVENYISANPSLPVACQTALRTNYSPEVQTQYQIMNAPDYSTFTGNPDDMRNRTMMDTNYDGHFWGNPFWDANARLNMLNKAIGEDLNGRNFQDAWAQKFVDLGDVASGKTAQGYFNPAYQAGIKNNTTDKDYMGDLPFATPTLSGNEPWHDYTTARDHYGYNNPCNNKPLMDVLIPIGGGVVAAAAVALIIPGQNAKIIGAVTAGTSSYLLLKAVVGFEALMSWMDGTDTTPKEYAALIFSVGTPVTLLQSVFDIGLAPESIQTKHIPVLAAGAALGYFVIYPIAEPLFEIGGGIFQVITAPLALLEEGLTLLFNGCAAHQKWSDDTCFCEWANTKPLIAEALMQIYGTTGEQKILRTKCLRNAMTNGSWSKDPILFGTCNQDDGKMYDKKGGNLYHAPCVPAGAWGFGEYSNFRGNEVQMQKELTHCFGADNTSFLPPVGADADCLKYGKYFRKQKDGTCKDMSAPDGMQGPGQFTEPDIDNSSCVIL